LNERPLNEPRFPASRSTPNPEEDPGPLSETDREHLRILSILHYVSAGLTAVGLCFAGLWTVVVFSMAGVGVAAGLEDPAAAAAPAAAFGIMGAFGVVMVLIGLGTLIAQYLAARNLHETRGRTLCLIVAAIECLNAPLGTALGVFTIVVLSRPAVQAVFEANDLARNDPYRPGSDF